MRMADLADTHTHSLSSLLSLLDLHGTGERHPIHLIPLGGEKKLYGGGGREGEGERETVRSPTWVWRRIIGRRPWRRSGGRTETKAMAGVVVVAGHMEKVETQGRRRWKG